MKTIWKYEVFNVLEMPKGAKILSLQVQNNLPHFWVLVDTEADKEKRIFSIYSTGFNLEMLDLDGKDKYIGTYQSLKTDFVWHVFEII
jgi:hypothetical protein